MWSSVLINPFLSKFQSHFTFCFLQLAVLAKFLFTKTKWIHFWILQCENPSTFFFFSWIWNNNFLCPIYIFLEDNLLNINLPSFLVRNSTPSHVQIFKLPNKIKPIWAPKSRAQLLHPLQLMIYTYAVGVSVAKFMIQLSLSKIFNVCWLWWSVLIQKLS